jgi:ribosomal protein S12 methylthiotransferase
VKFYIHKLGCPKNDVDADYLAARLIAAGHKPVADPAAADSVIVNTCGFIQDAKQESIDAILELARLKQKGAVRRLYATGCLSQRYGDELLDDMPELDGAFGLGMLDAVAEAVTGASRSRQVVRQDVRQLAYLDWTSRFLTDQLPYAYVKISDGCDRLCSYCAIPQMRGRYRSRPMESILNEARFLADNGKKELILVSQEATLWGSDLMGRPGLVDLLSGLDKVSGVEWIRLLYLHPARTNPDLVDYLASDNKTLCYFDLPLQHVNTELLHLMKRESKRDTIEKLLDGIRKRAPQAVLRVSFMVGFPGETEANFEELSDFVRAQRFHRLGVFLFSAEEGTAAAEFPNQIQESVKIQRMDLLMTLQQEIAFDRNNSLIGQTVEVIIDTVDSKSQAVGRTRGDCPEIDQQVLVGGQGFEVGEISRVRVDGAEGYDLIATKLAEEI